MKSLKIEIPKGFEVESFDEKEGIVKFRKTPKDIKSRIGSFDDVLVELGESDPEVIEYRKLQEAGVAQHILSNQEAVLITKALNEGWEPDWDDSNEYKYLPWFVMSTSGFRYCGYDSWAAHSHVGSRLCFKSRELAEYAGKQFTEVYKSFMIIN